MNEQNAKSLAEISESLVRLLSEPNRFVVLHAGDAFVQFDGTPRRSECGSFDVGSAVWIDLPTVALTEEQRARAVEMFAEWGVEGPTKDRCVDEKDRPITSVSWRCCCGTDTRKAAIRGFRVLRNVWGLRDERNVTLTEDSFD